MPTQHIVRDGQHLPGIAALNGFRDWRLVWDAPENEALRAARGNPCVLHPGDVVTLPDREPKQVACATAQRHTFRLAGTALKLRLRLQDPFGKPLANAPCELELDGATVQLTADGDGVIEHPVDPLTTSAMLRVDGLEMLLAVGAMDPVAEPVGAEARLANLALYPCQPGDHDEELLRFATQLFQAEQSLPFDGELGSIRDALRDEHGL